MDENYEKIIRLITEFSDKFLDGEYEALSVKLACRLKDTQKDIFDKGRPEEWACGIIYAIGQLNFLFDYSFDPFVPQEDLCYYFSAKRQKMSLKSRDIRRMLQLKLGDEEFSTGFVLSLNIPESDDDLKRIREFSQVKRQIKARRSIDAESVKNSEIKELIVRISLAENSDEKEALLRNLYVLLAPAFLIELSSQGGNLHFRTEGDKFMVPLFTSADECGEVKSEFENLEPKTWFFPNANYYVGNPNFEGILINPSTDEFLITKDMICRIYPYRDRVDYFRVFL